MRILLTGSSGWLGRFLAPLLRAKGHDVTGLDVAPSADADYLGSVADHALVDRVFAEKEIEAVIHSGALHKPDIERHSPEEFRAVNVEGTRNLLDAAAAAGNDRFIFTSTTSLMISEAVRAGKEGGAERAFWIDDDFGPPAPRNVYGTTKLEAELLCREAHARHGLSVLILRTARFFPEEDDSDRGLAGLNLKANEFLHRRLAVEDAARAHLAALDRAPALGFGTFILSAPPPFAQSDCAALIGDAPAVIAHYFPEAPGLYARAGWRLPGHIDRVYVPAKAERLLGFRCRVDFAAILAALASGGPLPFVHDPHYVSPGSGLPAR
jgi:UDP-glucose 4-epimerase